MRYGHVGPAVDKEIKCKVLVQAAIQSSCSKVVCMFVNSPFMKGAGLAKPEVLCPQEKLREAAEVALVPN